MGHPVFNDDDNDLTRLTKLIHFHSNGIFHPSLGKNKGGGPDKYNMKGTGSSNENQTVMVKMSSFYIQNE